MRKRMLYLLCFVLSIALLFAAFYVYISRRTGAPPENSPAACANQAGERPVLVFLGDSLTHGRVSANFVDLVAAHRPDLSVINAGINTELAYNMHRRLPAVLACRPKFVVVLGGTNDVNATLNARKEQEYLREMDLPAKPDAAFFHRYMENILADLRRAGVRTAVLSIPPIGEELESPANQRVLAYNLDLKDLAARHGAVYLPFSETMRAFLADKPTVSLCRDGEYHIVRAVLQRYVLGREWDEIGRGLGFFLTTDCLHLNDRAGAMAAGLVENWLVSLKP